jgi:ribosomal protein S18 acetylase RimI-like enzyme
MPDSKIVIKDANLTLAHIQFLSENLPRDPFLKLLKLTNLQYRQELTCIESCRGDSLIGVLLVGAPWNLVSVLLVALRKQPLKTPALLISFSTFSSMIGLLGKPRNFSKPNELLYIAVDQNFRGHGVASRLIQHASNKEVIVNGTWVRTLDLSSEALGLYKKSGFAPYVTRFSRTYLRYGKFDETQPN